MNEEKVIQMLLSHEERLVRIEENMSTQADVQQILSGQDKMTQILVRVDQERVFTNVRLERVESDVQALKTERKIKG